MILTIMREAVALLHSAITLLACILLLPLLVAAQEPGSKPSPPKEVKIEKVDTAKIGAATSVRRATPMERPSPVAGPGIPRMSVMSPTSTASATTHASAAPDVESELAIVDGVAKLLSPTGFVHKVYEPPTSPSRARALIATISPNEKWLAVYYHLREYPNEPYDKIYIYDFASGQRVTMLDANVYTDMQFSPDSTLLAFTSRLDIGKTTMRVIAEVWEVRTWKRLIAIEPPPHYRGISALAISPDNTMIALAGSLKYGLFPLHLEGQSQATPQKLEPIPGSENMHYDLTQKTRSMATYDITAIKFSPDGKFIFTVGEDRNRTRWLIR